MKPFKKAHSAVSWQDMKQHTKYNDPVRNYSALSSFYQMIIITSIHFTILPLAFYFKVQGSCLFVTYTIIQGIISSEM